MSIKTTQDYHADCIATATNIITKHPYFLTNLEHDSSSINFVEMFLETEDWKDPAFGVFFKTKNGEAGRDATFALMITKIIKERNFDQDGDEYETEYFEAQLIKKSTSEASGFYVVHKESSVGLITDATIAAMFYMALCPDMIAVITHGWASYRVPKQWRKSFIKTLDRLCVGRLRNAGDKYRNPAFYPKGTVVEFGNLYHSSDPDFKAQHTVTDVQVNGADSYILCTDQYKEKTSEFIDPRRDVNISHVTKIVKRGTGPQAGVSTAHFIHNRQRAKSQTGGMSFYECQKEAERRFNYNLNKKHTGPDWTNGGWNNLFSDYILTFKSGKLDYNFSCQFDDYAFLRDVSNVCDITDLHDFKFDLKKFKKQIGRIQCYLRKLRHVVREDAFEEERYYRDLNYDPEFN